MQLHFLAASVPLTKRYARLADGSLEKSSYPNVWEMSSHTENVSTTAELFEAIQRHAAQGHCVAKGQLRKQLVNESRAGQTDSIDPSQWIVFDLDGLEIATPEDFVQQILPPEFRDVSYVLQWSASSGIDTKPGLRCHLFFLMREMFQPEIAKTWLTHLNLTHATLSDGLSLTASAVALKFALDRTVVQNDKLIYIAPPECVGFVDPMGDSRVSLITKSSDAASFKFGSTTPAVVEELTKQKVNELREALGLPARVMKTKYFEHIGAVCTNPQVAAVTGERRSRGFVYLNLNGGNSFGYYFPEANPKYLHNFKGEPVYVLADIVPEYNQRLREAAPAEGGDPVGTPRPFAFRHQPTDTLWNGIYDEARDHLFQLAATSGGKKINDFYIQYGFAPPEHIEDWTFEFQPYNDKVVSFADRFCNRFERTEYMRLPARSAGIPPIIDRLIHSILGGDAACIDHFLNWLAWIFQKRDKSGTAWVLHGIEGTGKGVFYSKVLMPLFGEKYCVLKMLHDLDDKFNAELETNLLFVLDEAKMSAQSNASRTINQIKSLITEPYLSVRAMRANAAQIRNFSNFIFFSNDYDAMSISETDRRYNVAPRQEKRIQISPEEIESIDGELEQFAQFLLAYPADEQRAKTALDNDAKRLMRLAAQDAFVQLCTALSEGNLEYFMLFMRAELPVNQDIQRFAGFKQTMRIWLGSANTPTFITADQLSGVFAYLMPNERQTPQMLQRRLTTKNIVLQSKDSRDRGVTVTWKVSAAQQAAWAPLFAESLTGAAPGVRAAA